VFDDYSLATSDAIQTGFSTYADESRVSLVCWWNSMMLDPGHGRLIACLGFLDASEGGLRKLAELHIKLEEAYPKHVRCFLHEHGSEIPGFTEDLLLYNSRDHT